MNLSREDMFSEDQKLTAATAAVSSNILDFHAHGDDILHLLFWSLWVSAASSGCTLQVDWQTSDTEDFASPTTLFSKTFAAAELAKGAYPVMNETLPRGLRRFNRLKYTPSSGTTAPTVSAFIHDGRVEGQPLKGV